MIKKIFLGFMFAFLFFINTSLSAMTLDENYIKEVENQQIELNENNTFLVARTILLSASNLSYIVKHDNIYYLAIEINASIGEGNFVTGQVYFNNNLIYENSLYTTGTHTANEVEYTINGVNYRPSVAYWFEFDQDISMKNEIRTVTLGGSRDHDGFIIFDFGAPPFTNNFFDNLSAIIIAGVGVIGTLFNGVIGVFWENETGLTLISRLIMIPFGIALVSWAFIQIANIIRQRT